MLRLALSMLIGDPVKYLGLVLGVAFTAFLGTFAASYACGITTRSFSLIDENPWASVWVTDPEVVSVENARPMSDSALNRVRSIEGVAWAVPLSVASAKMEYADGRFQSVEIIGVDRPTFVGAPPAADDASNQRLRWPDAALVAAGGTQGKLNTPALEADRWAGPRLNAPTRQLQAGDEVSINDHRVHIAGRAQAQPRFPPRPLLYMTYANAQRILPVERREMSFVLVHARSGIDPQSLAARIAAQTGLAARPTHDFKVATVKWFLTTSEDVGDMTAMLAIAVLVGLGSTGVLLLMFTRDNLKYYALFVAIGARPRIVRWMVLAQAGVCALIGAGIGIGACAIAGAAAQSAAFPFRMLWFTPIAGAVLVALTTTISALASLRPAFRIDVGAIFAGR